MNTGGKNMNLIIDYDIYKQDFITCYRARVENCDRLGLRKTNKLFAPYYCKNGITDVPWFYRTFVDNFDISFNNFLSRFEETVIEKIKAQVEWKTIFEWRCAWYHDQVLPKKIAEIKERLNAKRLTMATGRISQIKKG